MKNNSKPHLHVAALSHPGEKREMNEDSFGISSYRLKRKRMPALLAVVADGIGGHQAGEVASQLTIDTIMNEIAKEDANEPLQSLRSAVISAGQQVAKMALQSPKYYGMGSTVAIAWVVGKRLYTANVGDSRIYFFRNGIVKQITTDHTWVQEAIKHEIIQPEEARSHPRAHILHLAIGSQDPPEPDFRLRLSSDETDSESVNNQGITLVRGDKVLLCSDGLTDLVEDHEIKVALQEQNPDEAVQSLISLARARGGHDNITTIIMATPEDWPEERAATRVRTLRLLLFALAAGIILAFLAAVAVFGILPLLDRENTAPTPSPTASITHGPSSLACSSIQFPTMADTLSLRNMPTPLPHTTGF